MTQTQLVEPNQYAEKDFVSHKLTQPHPKSQSGSLSLFSTAFLRWSFIYLFLPSCLFLRVLAILLNCRLFFLTKLVGGSDFIFTFLFAHCGLWFGWGLRILLTLISLVGALETCGSSLFCVSLSKAHVELLLDLLALSWDGSVLGALPLVQNLAYLFIVLPFVF